MLAVFVDHGIMAQPIKDSRISLSNDPVFNKSYYTMLYKYQ